MDLALWGKLDGTVADNDTHYDNGKYTRVEPMDVLVGKAAEEARRGRCPPGGLDPAALVSLGWLHRVFSLQCRASPAPVSLFVSNVHTVSSRP